MNLKQILDALERQMDLVFGGSYRDYFFGEWLIPWLPDDL